MIQATKPRVVVISLGAGLAYGHPDPMAPRYDARYGEAIDRSD